MTVLEVAELLRSSSDMDTAFQKLTVPEQQAYLAASVAGPVEVSVSNAESLGAGASDARDAASNVGPSSPVRKALEVSLSAAATGCSTGDIDQVYRGVVWPHAELYSMGFSAKWCYRSGKTTTFTILERHADTNWPGWSFEGWQPNAFNNKNRSTMVEFRVTSSSGFGRWRRKTTRACESVAGLALRMIAPTRARWYKAIGGR